TYLAAVMRNPKHFRPRAVQKGPESAHTELLQIAEEVKALKLDCEQSIDLLVARFWQFCATRFDVGELTGIPALDGTGKLAASCSQKAHPPGGGNHPGVKKGLGPKLGGARPPALPNRPPPGEHSAGFSFPAKPNPEVAKSPPTRGPGPAGSEKPADA